MLAYDTATAQMHRAHGVSDPIQQEKQSRDTRIPKHNLHFGWLCPACIGTCT